MVRKPFSPPPVGAVLRELRLGRNLSQEELGRRAGLSMTYVSLVETGKRNPTVTAVARVLAAVDITWEEFGRRVDQSGG